MEFKLYSALHSFGPYYFSGIIFLYVEVMYIRSTFVKTSKNLLFSRTDETSLLLIEQMNNLIDNLLSLFR